MILLAIYGAAIRITSGSPSSVIRSQAEVSKTEGLDHYEHEVVRLSLANLLTFPWIEKAIATGRLHLHGCRFDIRSGTLTVLEGNRFAGVE
jgi:carbonic anhydrase